ncbi:hypothetical protein AV274_5153 [Blastocystis sp. ATCC 50177/Nand II]|uniref:Inositol-1,3,4-trisphosphate 5/6-kinase n=1 Tax=Blastocystis sp. subtype 1 (strain ATCC 50177 / NandII) TaxID=478820 RepID=A0A196SAW6_BLAHN|nr:hypothetical protein AV274_5153 [Blastocystis sp. ATCC 50177/Nand II]
MNSLFRIAILLFLSLLCVVRTQDYEADENDMEEDPLSIGGGTQQTCDACRTVMEQLLQEWHTIDNDSFLEAIEEASHKKEYVPVVPEEESKRKEFESMVISRFMKRCNTIDIWIQYKPHIRKACEDIVKKSGSDIAHILVEKNKEVDTDIMNYLTRVVCMGLNRLCNIKYLNLDARSVNSKCEDCVNVGVSPTMPVDLKLSPYNNEIIHDATQDELAVESIRPFIVKVEAMLNKALLGVDFIIDASDPEKVYCVDINLFPSYTGFEGVSRLMGELIRKKCGVSE